MCLVCEPPHPALTQELTWIREECCRISALYTRIKELEATNRLQVERIVELQRQMAQMEHA